MRHVFSYYVTFMLLDNGIYKTGPDFGFMGPLLGQTEINFGELIKGVYITFSDSDLELRHGIHEYKEIYIINSDVIKKEVCEVLWDGIKPKYRNAEKDELEAAKEYYMKKFDKDVIILGWSEAALY